jgi:hypothetical protein
VKIDAAFVFRIRHRVRRHHRKIDVGTVLFRMRPDPLALVGRVVLVEPDAPHDPAHGFQRALAADAMDDEDRGSFLSGSWIEFGHGCKLHP